MKSSCKLQGGSSSLEREQMNIFVYVGIIVFMAVLAGLMWGGIIQFASDDQRNIAAGVITLVLLLLIFYVLFLVTVRGQSCGLEY